MVSMAPNTRLTVLTTLCLVFAINLAFPMYSSGLLNAAMAKDLHIDRRTIGIGFSMMLFTNGFSAPMAAWLTQRLGARRLIPIGSVVMALAAAALGTIVDSATSFVAIFGVVMGLGISLSTAIPAQASIAAWFFRRRAFALSMLWIAAGIGGFAAASALQWMLSSGHSWRAGWLTLCGLVLAMGLVSLIFVRDAGASPESGEQHLVSSNDSAKRQRAFKSSLDWSTVAAFRTPTMLIITLCVATYSASVGTFLAHAAAYVSGTGFTGKAAAFILSMYSLGTITGKLTSGVAGDRLEPRFLMGCGLLVLAAGLAWVVLDHAASGIYPAGFAVGFGSGAFVVCWPTIVANYFGSKSLARILAVQTPVATLVGAIGPIWAGAFFDRTGTYSAAFCTLAAFTALTGCLGGWLAKPPKSASTLSGALSLEAPVRNS